jgi:CRISPR-associated protein Csb2
VDSQLVISVTLLDAEFHGKVADAEAEWPPSPLRLFAAILAGSRTGCRNRSWDTLRQRAFEWFSRQSAPLIIAPIVREGTKWTLYVPNNQSDALLERGDTLTEKIVCPTQLLGGDTIHYIYPVNQEDEGLASVISQEAKHIMALGWGIDFAVGRGQITTSHKLQTFHGVRWLPWKLPRTAVSHTLRIPTAGTLQDCEDVFAWSRDRFDPATLTHKSWYRLTVYDSVEYLQSTTLAPRPFGVVEFDEDSAVNATQTACVAVALRKLLGQVAVADGRSFPGGNDLYVGEKVCKGESAPERFSYLPLPTIGHPHADSFIRRILLAEPFGGSGTYAKWAHNRLLGSQLDVAPGVTLTLLDPWRPSTKRLVTAYASESRTWCSVTPVILPRFNGHHARHAEDIFLEACRQASLPVNAISDIILRKAPFYPGAQHPQRYWVPPYLQGLPRWNVMIVFRDYIPGPLAIGAGRYIGLGTFAHAIAAAP